MPAKPDLGLQPRWNLGEIAVCRALNSASVAATVVAPAFDFAPPRAVVATYAGRMFGTR